MFDPKGESRVRQPSEGPEGLHEHQPPISGTCRSKCRRGDLNPHELALTRPSTYEGLSGECRFLLLERAPCGRTFEVVGLRPGRVGWVCHQDCHQRGHPVLLLARLSVPGRFSLTRSASSVSSGLLSALYT